MKSIREQKNASKRFEKNWMECNPLWLLEELCEQLGLAPRTKVLDMGCETGIASIFLTKEYDVAVFANDL